MESDIDRMVEILLLILRPWHGSHALAAFDPHLGHVLTRLGLRDRAAAIVYAFDTGLVAPGG